MPNLKVRFIHTPTGMNESVLASIDSDRYDPELLDSIINACLDKALEKSGFKNLAEFKKTLPEISVLLSSGADEKPARPSLHLSSETMRRCAEAGVSFDFDPYI